MGPPATQQQPARVAAAVAKKPTQQQQSTQRQQPTQQEDKFDCAKDLASCLSEQPKGPLLFKQSVEVSAQGDARAHGDARDECARGRVLNGSAGRC